jgi:phosphatidylglycerophosphatase C
MITVYDFDKTLTYDDTTMMFLFYCCNTLKQRKVMKFFIVIFAVLHKIRVLNNNKFKSLSYGLVFKGKKKQTIINIAKAFAEKNSDIFNSLGQRVWANLGEQDYIVTASPKCYVELYFPKMIVIGTTFSFDDDEIFRGLKVNCYGKNKVIALKKVGVLKIDEFYTDSFSDMPLMKISKSVFLVERDVIRKL